MSTTRYLPLGPLLAGEGSRAVLGLALTDNSTPRPVVLIYAPDEVLRETALAEHLVRETQRATVFEHPNIMRVHGLVEVEQRLARVTEYADGESLRRLLEIHPRLPPGIAAMIVAEAATGVAYAHVAGNDDGSPFVHGDLRPETLMLSFSGVTKVTGYGALGVAPREGTGRRVPQRRFYSAPEQLLGGREAVNVQTDVYLLGLILAECLTGAVPFKDQPNFDQAVLNKRLPPLPGDVPSGLDKVVRRALSKRAQERYPSALAFREALLLAAGPLPTQAEFAAFLSQAIPETDEARVTRRRLLDDGLANAARRAPAAVPTRPANAPLPKPPPPPVAPPVVLEPPLTPRAQPVVTQAPAAGPATPTPPPARASLLPWILLGLVVVGFTAFLLGRSAGPGPVPPPVAAPVSVPDASVAVAEVPPPVPPALDAGAVAEVPVADAGVAVAATPPAPVAPPPPPPPPPEPSSLELVVDPPVNVTVNKQPLGKSPVTAPLPPGRYTVQLVDRAQGINTTRVVTVGRSGKTTQRISLGKGVVKVDAPAGSTIFVDGKKVGVAPLGDVPIYEGSHMLLVTINGAKWQQGFRVAPNERMDYTVEFEPQ